MKVSFSQFARLSALSLCVAASMATVACGSKHFASSPADGEGSSIQSYYGGTRLSEGEVANYIRDAGFPEYIVGTMVCVAKYESDFYTGAVNDNGGGNTDYGLFQINNYAWDAACPGDLLDPSYNSQCALKVYQQQGLDAWYGYQAHRGECDSYYVEGGGSRSSCSETAYQICLAHNGGADCEKRRCN